MHNILNDMEKEVKTDLDLEYKNALKNPNFKEIVKRLNLSSDILKKYTSLIEESSKEYEHCKNCTGLFNCLNKMEGYCYLPINIGGISFTYKPCKYKIAMIKKNSHLSSIKFFNTPDNIKSASLDDIYKTDKNRFEVINWLMDFLDDFLEGRKCKGLYLHGNFGCGKTYLIAALFNELARKNYKSIIVFWPEFIRGAFQDDFHLKYEQVKKIPLLLIDDIGAENLTAYNRDEILCPLLQYRMDNNLATFFTSNLNIKELEQHLSISKNGVDIVKARRIISRVEQLTIDMELISKNLR